MSHRWLGLETLVGIPCEALCNKVDKQLIVTLEYSCERLGARAAASAFCVDEWAGRASGI
jgi:hypothetical protein